MVLFQLYNTQYALADGIHDMPRLGKVLSNELVSDIIFIQSLY